MVPACVKMSYGLAGAGGRDTLAQHFRFVPGRGRRPACVAFLLSACDGFAAVLRGVGVRRCPLPSLTALCCFRTPIHRCLAISAFCISPSNATAIKRPALLLSWRPAWTRAAYRARVALKVLGSNRAGALCPSPSPLARVFNAQRQVRSTLWFLLTGTAG